LKFEGEMQEANHIAFKEWAVICAALAEGRQSLILRKGGIHEGPDGFQVEHNKFWLFPTYVHEQAAALTDEARPLLEQVERDQPSPAYVCISLYAVVEDVLEVRDSIVLPSLAGLHVWSDRMVDHRFHYKRPGLFVLCVRVFALPQSIKIPNSPHFAGCRTWVDLPMDLSTAGLKPVLSDEEFSRRLAAIRVATSPIRLA
jgi:hypothetical protein